MAIRLIATFDGDVRGLSEHRISLAAFLPAFNELLRAYRRTASNILTAAVGDAGDGGSATGRLHKQALSLDLELSSVEEGCARPGFVATQAAVVQQVLFSDLPRRAADRLLLDIEAESQGRAQSVVVRNFLQALPAGLQRQEYDLYDGAEHVRHVAFGHAALVELPPKLPSLLRLSGLITGLGFVPGNPYVEFLPTGRSTPVLCYATTEQVEAALPLRGTLVEAQAVLADRPRLLSVRRADAPSPVASPTERVLRIHTEWHSTLTALAR